MGMRDSGVSQPWDEAGSLAFVNVSLIQQELGNSAYVAGPIPALEELTPVGEANSN